MKVSINKYTLGHLIYKLLLDAIKDNPHALNVVNQNVDLLQEEGDHLITLELGHISQPNYRLINAVENQIHESGLSPTEHIDFLLVDQIIKKEIFND